MISAKNFNRKMRKWVTETLDENIKLVRQNARGVHLLIPAYRTLVMNDVWNRVRYLLAFEEIQKKDSIKRLTRLILRRDNRLFVIKGVKV